MNIGLITLHSFFNYGSMLQAYALQHYLDSLPMTSCELIDYAPPRQDNNRAYFLYQDLPEYAELREKYRDDLVKRRELFGDFMKLYKLSRHYGSDEELEADPPKYDAYVSGSDQIWNVNFRIASRAYFLAFAKKAPKFAFATSVGRAPREKLEAYGDFIRDYKRIYIREESGRDVVQNLTQDKVETMCDPTWLFDGDFWRNRATQGRITDDEYIACYATLNDQLQDMMPILKKLHEKFDLPAVLFGMGFPKDEPWIKNVVAAGPLEFLQILSGAKFILTMSFHGTAFSMNFGIPFLTFNDSSINLRKTGLLQRFNLSGRIVHNSDEVEQALTVPLDFAKMQKQIDEERKWAKREIGKCLEDV